jgi:hypothetical protein
MWLYGSELSKSGIFAKECIAFSSSIPLMNAINYERRSRFHPLYFAQDQAEEIPTGCVKSTQTFRLPRVK